MNELHDVAYRMLGLSPYSFDTLTPERKALIAHIEKAGDVLLDIWHQEDNGAEIAEDEADKITALIGISPVMNEAIKAGDDAARDLSRVLEKAINGRHIKSALPSNS